VQLHEARRKVRSTARAYEQALDPVQRKQLGQFFTGVPLGRLLAHLALRPDTRTVLDPMAGHGDLLEASWEAAAERGIPIERLDGIEIDDAVAETCRGRIAALVSKVAASRSSIIAGDAFDPATFDALATHGYDLVIGNPPYVRYQMRTGSVRGTDPVREGLVRIVGGRQADPEHAIWKVLAQGYSGLADLSVPAWILSCFLVRPGGRLALVVPATWRSRNYADVIRYLLLRCFALEAIVADTQPGWFSDALVRTHLIVARRLTAAEARQPVCTREHSPEALWIRVAPTASSDLSLVGAAFRNEHPEAAFASWVDAKPTAMRRGIDFRTLDLRHEGAMVHERVSRRHWYAMLEGNGRDLPLFTGADRPASVVLPQALRDMLPPGTDTAALISLEEAGIRVGQGLRTGCNAFFYVTVCGTAGNGGVLVRASPALGSVRFAVPSGALQPVLRRQAEVRIVERGEVPSGRVLDLRGWVLPEDVPILVKARVSHMPEGADPPRVMPAALAAFVRLAATTSLDGSSDGKPIPELSAVRTNARQPGYKGAVPRFWYMLPDFAPRHLPLVYVPRVNHGTPWSECNMDPPILVDANFSTFWTSNHGWSRFSVKALLNSVWCRAFMEASGTPLGGGALKLEATHLRQMLIPVLSESALAALDEAGRRLLKGADGIRAQVDRIVLQALLPGHPGEETVMDMISHMSSWTSSLCADRQRIAR